MFEWDMVNTTHLVQDMPNFGIQPDDVTYSTVTLTCLFFSTHHTLPESEL